MHTIHWRENIILASLSRITVVCQFLNIMHQAVQLPLPIHLGFSTQHKAVQSLVAGQVAKYRFHCCTAARDHLSARPNQFSPSSGRCNFPGYLVCLARKELAAYASSRVTAGLCVALRIWVNESTGDSLLCQVRTSCRFASSRKNQFD